MREIELRGSNLDTFVVEEQGHLAVYCARLGSLVVIILFAGYWQAFIFESDRPWLSYFFFGRQPPTLTARVDRVLADLDQNDRPVAQKMRTGLFYLALLFLEKNGLNFCVLIQGS